MTDLINVLPDFDLRPWRHLIFSLEKNDISISELLSLDSIEIVRRCPLPLRDLQGLVKAVTEALQHDLNLKKEKTFNANVLSDRENSDNVGTLSAKQEDGPYIRILDSTIDECLGGGILTRHITEIVGESAVGKTQFVLSLLLSVQLPPPYGLGRPAVYISTESPLSTRRLAQILSSNPEYEQLPMDQRPSLNNVHAIEVRDLEAQEHVIQYQLPVVIQQYNIGLLVIDSVAANYRSEFETKTVKGLSDRAVELVRLGSTLKRLSIKNDLAVVVTNQVSDRFEDVRMNLDRLQTSSPMPGSSPTPGTQESSLSSSARARRDGIMSLDHQQRYFTGWGDGPSRHIRQLKTPAMGMTWTNQISARIVLRMGNERKKGKDIHADTSVSNKRRRHLAVVFAPWVEPSLHPIEYELQSRGPVSVAAERTITEAELSGDATQTEHTELLDPQYWIDDAENEEFP